VAGGTAVVVLHWGDVRDTRACVASLAASRVRAEPLLVVDNGTGGLREEELPGAEIVRLPENVGYAGGNNVGIRRALAGGARWVVLVNNDAVLDPGCLGELVRAAEESGARVGAVGAKVFSAADPSRLWMAYGRLTYRAALVERVGQGAADGPDFAGRCEPDWVSGCVILLARGALEDVGLLDERFFAYHEDVDWCTSARRRGYRVVFAPDARAVHRGGASVAARRAGGAVRYLSARNTVLFARKHAGVRDWLRLGLTIGTSVPLAYLRDREARADVRLLVRGYRDGLLGRELPYAALGLR
jgi:GT2 family glycosyltransferase